VPTNYQSRIEKKLICWTPIVDFAEKGEEIEKKLKANLEKSLIKDTNLQKIEKIKKYKAHKGITS